METSKIFNIEKQVWNNIKNENHIGLLRGLSGIALFYSKLYEVYEDETYGNKLFKVVERIDTLIAENSTAPTFYSGLAGYGWMLLNLKKNTITISGTYFKTLDSLLEKALHSFSKKNNYDFLHGAIGVAMYFMERLKYDKNNPNLRSILTRFSKDFLNKLIYNIEEVISIAQGNNKMTYFGLAHGISSFINFIFFVSQYIKSLVPEIKQALITLIHFLKSKKSFDPISQQYYPNYIDNQGNIGSSRLGWCQGDLGIGLALYNTGVLLNNYTIKQEAKDLITSTKKITLKASAVYDYGLCHGSIGLVIQYYLAQKKGILNTTDIQKRWYQELEQQTCNFTSFKTYIKSGFMETPSMLSGTAGLGMALLTLEGKINSNWLRCLNLY